MEKDKALMLWDEFFGKDVKWAQDCFGTWIYRDDYGDTKKKRVRPGNTTEYEYGWEVDHIRPKCDFGENADPDLFNNYEIMHWRNNRAKGDNYPQFTIDDKEYKVIKCDICGQNNLKGYGIVDSNENRIDWKGRKNRYFIRNK